MSFVIKFPVIRHFSVEGYELYQNGSNDGISHEMHGGTHLIVGINGLGKTTLLNILFRGIVGPFDFPKGNDSLGGGQHKLGKWQNKNYFSNRVLDNARNAKVKLDISFGDKKVEVVRKLSNLEITKLYVEGEECEASQDQYEQQVLSLSGFADYVDFFAVIKHLLFFLEDRSELIWDYRAQFEMFKILFYSSSHATTAAEHLDEAQKADSKFRNIKAALSTAKKEADELNSERYEELKTEYDLQQNRFEGVELRLEDKEAEIDDLNIKLRQLKLLKSQNERALAELRFGLEQQQNIIYKHYFPDINETIQLLLAEISSGNGCLVCGNQSVDVDTRFREAISNHSCPMCDSELRQNTNPKLVASSIDTAEARIAKLEKEIARIVSAIESNAKDFSEIQESIRNAEDDRSEILEEYETVAIRLRQLKKALPKSDSDIEQLERTIRLNEAEVAKFVRIYEEHKKQYLLIVQQNEDLIKIKLKKLKERFSSYCKRLLAEDVDLQVSHDDRRVGESGKKEKFPCVKVSMTSGTSVQQMQTRHSPEDVSESQREFIDLAFRFALIEVVSDESSSPAMIVMETPEASLDSVFMEEASLLFREFSAKQDGRNVFLASTNLNESGMISYLLGAIGSTSLPKMNRVESILDERGTDNTAPAANNLYKIGRNDREKHIVNLLELAARNKALKLYEERYWNMYQVDWIQSFVHKDTLKCDLTIRMEMAI
jgi:archaellum component FlaC